MGKNFSSFENLNTLFTYLGNILRRKPEAAEMTKEAYDALTPTQQNDNTIRFITNYMSSNPSSFQVYSLPTASASLNGVIYQYVGPDTGTLTNGYTYQCKEVGGIYTWVEKPSQDSTEVTVTSSGTASSSDVHKQMITVDGTATDIDGTVYMEQSVTLSTTDPTIVTFTNATITANSVIDVYCSVWDMVPENVSCAAGTCAVTLPADEDARTVTVRIYVR